MTLPSTSSGPYLPEDLATSRERFGELVASLTRDGVADPDQVGAIWVAGTRAPPRGESITGWIRTVGRNLLRLDRRERSRRLTRERMVAQSEALPSTADVLAEEEARARLLRAVLALSEPSRTIVLLRFWRGLDGTGIAKQLGVPATTVRDRLALGVSPQRIGVERDGYVTREHALDIAPPASPVRITIERAK